MMDTLIALIPLTVSIALFAATCGLDRLGTATPAPRPEPPRSRGRRRRLDHAAPSL